SSLPRNSFVLAASITLKSRLKTSVTAVTICSSTQTPGLRCECFFLITLPLDTPSQSEGKASPRAPWHLKNGFRDTLDKDRRLRQTDNGYPLAIASSRTVVNKVVSTRCGVYT